MGWDFSQIQNPFGTVEQLGGTPSRTFFDASRDQVDPQSQVIPHYPAQRYIDKNLAPEKNITQQDIFHLGKARQLAEQQGLISPQLGEHLLPIAMIEGRGGNFGMNPGSIYAHPKTVENFRKLGLNIRDETTNQYVSQPSLGPLEIRPNRYKEDSPIMPTDYSPLRISMEYPERNSLDKNGKPILNGKTGGYWKEPDTSAPKQRMLSLTGEDMNNPEIASRLMVGLLAEKARGNKSVEDTIKAYNGSGPATEQYLKKVQEAKAMLMNPKNERILKAHNYAYKSR